MDNNILLIVSDKKQLKATYDTLIKQYNPCGLESPQDLGLNYVPEARGFCRKSKATIEVWSKYDFRSRKDWGTVPQFHIHLFIDRELPRGILRRLLMLWDDIPDYEVRGGTLVRV